MKNDYSCGGSTTTVKVTSVSVYPACTTLKVGDWFYGASATVYPSNATNKTVTWRSSNTSVATVNASSGLIYAKATGSANIYATAADGSGKSDFLAVTVTNGAVLVNSVELNRSSLSLDIGKTFSLSATVCPENAANRSLSWSSSNPTVATVTGGCISALAKGTTIISATANDGSGKSASCTVTVTNGILAASVTVAPSRKTMTVGDSSYLYATVCPENATNRSVVWRSSNPCVATVNATSGLVHAKEIGAATIFATAADGSGKEGNCAITVTGAVSVSSITLNASNLTLNKGQTYSLSAAVCPENATNRTVRWSSSDYSIACVSASGVVSAKNNGGTVIISATALDGSGVSASCIVTVKQTTTEKPEEEKPESKVDGSTVADPVDVYSGAHLIENTVMTLFGGQALKLTVRYDSTKLLSGSLGSGWYHSYEKYLEISGSEARVYSSPSVYAKYDSEDGATFICSAPNRNGYILQVDTAQTYPYTLHCNSECTEYYNTDGKLAKIVDHQGFETLITYTDSLATVTDTVSGKKIYLEKNADGRISKVYDDAEREVTFTYSSGLLTGICDVNGNTLTYTYDDENRIQSGVDSKEICYFYNTYDTCGRVISQRDGIAGSVPSTFVYESNGKRITTDRCGRQSIRIFDQNGLLVSHSDENGNTKTYTYDERFNVVKETDARGNSVVKVYNSFNKPTEITDKNGNTTYITYDAAGNVVKIRYPEIDGEIPEETFAYNSRSQIIQHTDLRGTVTVYTYDAASMPASKKEGSRNAVLYSYQNGLLVSQTDAMGNTTQYGHNAIGQTTSITDADQHTTSYEYDAAGNLLKVTDANGKSIINTYDGNHQKTSVTDARGNKTEYSYNGNMKNTSVTTPDGYSVQYEFDGEDRPVKTIDKAGNVTTIQYDDAGRVLSKHFPDGGTVQYEYDEAGNPIKEINSKGAVTVKTYDAAGNVLSVTDNDGNTTRFQYNAMSKVVRAVNAVSGTVTYRYSAAGDLLCETDALGNKKTYTYDAFGNKLTFTDANGNTTSYTYDAAGNLLTVKDALNNITTYTYNSLNQLVSVKDAKNNVVTYGYDALGRRTTVTDAKNNVFTVVYDANGNVLKNLDAKGNTIREMAYNNMNLPTTVIDSTGKATTYTYNAIGKTASATDSLNNRQEYSYNTRGLNTGVTDAANHQSTAAYDTLGNVTQLSGPLGGVTNYTYDNMGRLISESTASGGTVSYGYNELNVKKQLTNARGQIKKYFYDAMGRITGYVGAEDSVSYTYDAVGNVLTVTDRNGTIKREYDALNRITKYTDTFGKAIRYEYDAVGNLVKMIYPDDTAVNYAYDANNALTTVTDWAGRVTAYTYDANGKVTGVTKPDGSITTTVYDSKQRITSTVEKTSSGVIITGFEYTYDALGRIFVEKHLANGKKLCYTYDSLSRVTKRTVTDLNDVTLSEETFSYDAAGNLVGGSSETGFVHDTNNRLISIGGETVSYDADGNMLSMTLDGEERSLTYDSANRLLKAGDCEYAYNAEDIRIRNLCGEDETVYTYDTNTQLSRLLVKMTSGVTTKYVYGMGLIGEETESTFKTYHFDYRGSTVAITDSAGTITDTFQYDTYGKQTARTGTSEIIFGYNGRDGVITDSNSLLYMRARYYSPELRRFINADIIAGEISNAITLNRYAYANGNPVSNVDPFGLSAERGSIVYGGNTYNIFIPNSPNDLDGWTVVKNIEDSDWKFFFSLGQFLTGFEADDFNGIADGSNPMSSMFQSSHIRNAGILGLALGALNSVLNSVDIEHVYYNITFYQKDDKRRAVIQVGSSSAQNLFDRYADDQPHSFMMENMTTLGDIPRISYTVKKWYDQLTGQHASMKKDYDLEVTADSAHKNSKYSSYLWIDSNGTLMETPMIYENDKVEIGYRHGFFWSKFTPLLSIPLGGSSPAPDLYQKMLAPVLGI